ncbi:hypothetical protein M0802_004556 [Mischocyttarus mexicanus]|nr:hypothetical protein M0802_004556 [Mischocyttarus mexicanus]
MSTLIFGIGTGLFLILTLWAIAIITFLISLRIEKKIGSIIIIVIGLLTIILFSIPRASDKPNVNERKQYARNIFIAVCCHVILSLLPLV